jgi:RNA recognition motif-containing protein
MADDIHREVFIKNIPYEISDDDLSEWCTSFGPITKCVLKRDRFGNSRGFAFVTYETVEGHNNICKNNFHIFCRR